MGWWNKLVRNKKASEDKAKAEAAAEAKAKKDLEPWVKVVNIDINPENPSQGFFELDWNEPFVELLASNGYTGATPEEVVDNWFTDLCKGIARSMNADGFVVDEDVIKLSDLQKAENTKSKK